MSPWSFPYPFSRFYSPFPALLSISWAKIEPDLRTASFSSTRRFFLKWLLLLSYLELGPQNPTNLDSGAPQKSEVYVARIFLYKWEKNGCLLKDWKRHTFPSGIWLRKIICVWPNFYQELSNGNFFEGPENPTNATFLFSGFFFKALIRGRKNGIMVVNPSRRSLISRGKGWHSGGWYPSILTIWVGSTTLWRRI